LDAEENEGVFWFAVREEVGLGEGRVDEGVLKACATRLGGMNENQRSLLPLGIYLFFLFILRRKRKRITEKRRTHRLPP